MATNLAELTADNFRPGLGRPFTLTGQGGTRVKGRLVLIKERAELARPGFEGRAPFALFLVSPERNADPNGMLGTLHVEGLEPLPDVFANPIVGDPRPEWGTGRLWQIVFN